MTTRHPSALRSFLSAATDPRALAWPAMAILLATYVLLDLLTVGVSATALTATVIAFAVQWGAMWVANAIALKRAWARRHPMLATIVLFFVILIVGAIASSALVAPHTGATPLWRFALTLVVSAVYVLLVDYRADVAREKAAQVTLREARDSGARALVEQREAVVGRLVQTLDDALAQPPTAGAQGAMRVRELAREQIRPLSHELIASLPPSVEPRRIPSSPPSWRQILDAVLSTTVIPPLVTAVAVTVFFISRTVVWFSTTDSGTPTPPPSSNGVSVSLDIASLLWSWAGLVLVFGVTYLVARVVRRFTNPILPRLSLGRRVALAVAAPLVIAVAIEIAVQVVYLTPMVSDSLKAGFFQRIILAVPIVVVALAVVVTRTLLALITVARDQEVEVTEELSWQVARINETLHQERRFFAMQAHGPIQSAAAAAAVRIDGATDEEALTLAWSQASSDLRRAIDVVQVGPGDAQDLTAAVASLASAWEGICEITLECEAEVVEALEHDWVANACTIEIVTEAIGNATMHGSASHVYIGISLVAIDELCIEVVNDGAPLDEDVEQGLGSRTLDDVTLDWSRMNTTEGVRFEARIPALGRV